jgi:hypothetical protein
VSLSSVSVVLAVLVGALAVVATGLAGYGWARERGTRPRRVSRRVDAAMGVVYPALAGAVALILAAGAMSHLDDLPWEAPWWVFPAPGAAAVAVRVGLVASREPWRRWIPRSRWTRLADSLLVLGVVRWPPPAPVVLLAGGVLVAGVWLPFQVVHEQHEALAAAPVVELGCVVTDRYVADDGDPAPPLDVGPFPVIPAVPFAAVGALGSSGGLAHWEPHELVDTDRCGTLEDIDATGRPFDDVREGDCFTVDVRDYDGEVWDVHSGARVVAGGRFHGNVGRRGPCPPPG